MSGKNWGRILHNNIVLLTGVPLIIGIHWGWLRIQRNPDLVDTKNPHELPIYTIYRNLYTKLLGNNTKEGVTNADYKESLKD